MTEIIDLLSIENPSIESGLYMLTEEDIIVLEQLQKELAEEKYQTARRRTTWYNIERLINQRYVQIQLATDRRKKISRYCNTYIYLGESYRIDRNKASFIQTYYLDPSDHKIFTVDHCCRYSIR